MKIKVFWDIMPCKLHNYQSPWLNIPHDLNLLQCHGETLKSRTCASCLKMNFIHDKGRNILQCNTAHEYGVHVLMIVT